MSKVKQVLKCVKQAGKTNFTAIKYYQGSCPMQFFLISVAVSLMEELCSVWETELGELLHLQGGGLEGLQQRAEDSSYYFKLSVPNGNIFM